MSVQLVLLKSGEEIVADVREMVDRETGKPLSMVLIKPVRITVVKQGLLNEETNQPQSVLNFEPWVATSKSEEYFIDGSWVVTVCEPNDDIRESYIKNIGVRNDSESDFIEDGTVSDSGD